MHERSFGSIVIAEGYRQRQSRIMKNKFAISFGFSKEKLGNGTGSRKSRLVVSRGNAIGPVFHAPVANKAFSAKIQRVLFFSKI